jgi:predicted heme/steroid binding protein
MRRTLPATAHVNEFQYATELTSGWCAITHPHERIGFGIAFDRRVLPSCWLFATYGGWRDLSTVVLEPCTGYPVSLAQGVRNGTHQVLHAGDTISCDVVATVFTGGSGVGAIDSDGNVTVLEHEGKH